MKRTKPWPKGSLSTAPRALKALGKKWEKRLGLEHWQINYYMSKRQLRSCAETRWESNYLGGGVAFDPVWYEQEIRTPEEIEATVVHELTHFVFARMDDSMSDLFGAASGVFTVYHDARETVCDQFAAILIKRYVRKKD